ncbi:hypothetical protein ZIOFF_010521 [Zingiber officinale]|uniref:Co-chaperone protein p23 n=1 Tax=Zingiber officinale TaxID=94328 RepID=A0A8J5I0G0_ZINOF|nr:hypothetical protein ZIOFF_010521 [Zingiber officinale]
MVEKLAPCLEMEEDRCERHPEWRRSLGVCPLCLTEKLSNLSSANSSSPLPSNSNNLSSSFSPPPPPPQHGFARTRISEFQQKLLNQSPMLSSVFGKQKQRKGEEKKANRWWCFWFRIKHSENMTEPTSICNHMKHRFECLQSFGLHLLLSPDRHPSTKWAQSSDTIYITIELPDAKDVKLTLQPEGRFYFSATSGAENIPYELDFELFDKVNVDESKTAVGLRTIYYLIKKADKKWWSRLLKQGGKPPVYLKVDWDKWIDEEDEKENKSEGMNFDGMDFSNLNMGGVDDELDGDEDDDDEFAHPADEDGEDDVDDAEEAKPNGEQTAATSEPESKA